jgi:hypothetical protein
VNKKTPKVRKNRVRFKLANLIKWISGVFASSQFRLAGRHRGRQLFSIHLAEPQESAVEARISQIFAAGLLPRLQTCNVL